MIGWINLIEIMRMRTRLFRELDRRECCRSLFSHQNMGVVGGGGPETGRSFKEESCGMKSVICISQFTEGQFLGNNR